MREAFRPAFITQSQSTFLPAYSDLGVSERAISRFRERIASEELSLADVSGDESEVEIEEVGGNDSRVFTCLPVLSRSAASSPPYMAGVRCSQNPPSN